jgi:peptidoglycan/xylan/chitin deacetylase (PgdA/CDA1 family)
MKESHSKVIVYSGLPFAIRELIARKRVTILVYHDPKPEVFEQHLNYLLSHYKIIPLRKLVNSIRDRDWENIPKKCLCITFDDAHKGNFDLLEILKKYQIPITIFACAGIINTNRHYWFLEAVRGVEQLKLLNNKERFEHLSSVYGFTPTSEFDQRQALSIDEIKKMEDYGVDFQCHSSLHPILVSCTDDECWNEINNSKLILERLLEKQVCDFAYPNGSYGERELKLTNDAGYRSARTTDVGWNGPDTDIYALKAMVVSDDAPLAEMIVQSTGINEYLHLIKKFITGKR